jgi:excisionase family DNA binding protein
MLTKYYSLQSAKTMLNTFYPVSFPSLPFEIGEPNPPKKEKWEKVAGAALSSTEAADYLNISVRTLRRMCHRKSITFLKITPHKYSFDLHDPEEYKRSRRNKRRNAVQW